MAGLTSAERKALMDEKVLPPRGETKKTAEIFKPGMKPPVDPDMGSAQPGQPGQPVKKAKGGKVKRYADGGDIIDELSRGVRRVGQDLGIAEDTNQYKKTPQGEKMANSDVAKGARNYVRLQKEGMGVKSKNDEYEKKKGGVIKSASARADGCAVRGKTRA
jgi:hypothetical protein